MKRTCILVLILLLAGVSAVAGVKYSGTIKIELSAEQQKAQQNMRNISPEEKAMMKKMGMDPDSMSSAMKGYSFDAMADSGRVKMVFTSPFFFFRKGSYMLGDSGKKISYYVFPDKRQYVSMDTDKVQDFASDAQQKFKMTYSGLQVNITPLAPKVINGLPCTGKRITVAYSLTTHMMGRHTSREKRVTDYYTTTKYDAMAFFGGHNWHTKVFSVGYAPYDKIISDKVGFLGFPVMARTTSYSNGKTINKTTLTITNVHLQVIPASTFQLPAGYTKTTIQNMSRGQFGRGSHGDNNGSREQQEKHRSLKDILSGFND